MKLALEGLELCLVEVTRQNYFSKLLRHNKHFSSATDLSESHHFERNTMCDEESDCELGMESFFAGRRFFFVEVKEDVNDVRKLHQVEAGARSA